MYAWGTLMTPCHNLRFSLIAFIVIAISVLLTLGSMSGSLYLFSRLFWPASRLTVISLTPVTFQSREHLHLWWKRKLASFRLSWAITETYCPLSDILLALLPPGFLMKLQISSTFLSVRTLSLSGLSSPCSLTNNMAVLGLNPRCRYISWSHNAMISSPFSQCTCWICVIMSWWVTCLLESPKFWTKTTSNRQTIPWGGNAQILPIRWSKAQVWMHHTKMPLAVLCSWQRKIENND